MAPSPSQPLRRLSLGSLLVVALLITVATTQDDDEEPISVGAPVTALKVGDSGEIECSSSLTGVALTWHRAGDINDTTTITDNSTIRVSANRTTGLLTINDAQLSDAGEYTCRTDRGNHTVTATLKVYELPTYFKTGMILVGVNAGLVVIFLTCALYSFVNNKCRKARLAKENPKAGLKKTEL